MKTDRATDALERALEDWARHGNEQPLTRWLRHELDSQGALYRLPISDWHDCVEGGVETQTSWRRMALALGRTDQPADSDHLVVHPTGWCRRY